MNIRGVTPVIATVMLIGIVIILAATVFIWAQGFITEGIEKRGEPIERSCDAVLFDASVIRDEDSYLLDINNRADIPIYSFEVKILGEGGEARVRSTPEETVEAGSSVSILLPEGDFGEVYAGEASELVVIPVLLGTRKDARLFYPCPEQYGRGVSVGV